MRTPYDKPNRRARVVLPQARSVSAERKLELEREPWQSSIEEERRKDSRKRQERRQANARGERAFSFRSPYGVFLGKVTLV